MRFFSKYGYGRTLLLTAVMVGIAAGGAVGQVDITEKFKDPIFRAEVYRLIRKTAPAPILDSDVSSITIVSVNSKSIADLSGIEYFTALTSLGCGDNQLTTLDVSKNTALTELYCEGNQLTTLDVSKNTALTDLECYSNQLTSLDVSENTELWRLYCYSNQLTTLDVSKNTALTYLFVGYNYFVSEDDIIGLNKSNLVVFEFDPQRDPNRIFYSDRAIPIISNPAVESSIAPVKPLTVNFTAAPNPAVRSSGAVSFLRNGALLNNAVLTIYDASGNVVAVVKSGVWDLRDAGGRAVSSGTYLARGVVKTKDGKSEKVSLVVGVR